MKKVYSHENRLLVFNVRNLLGDAGITCFVKNEYASGGVGDLSPFETWPEIWVDDKDEQAAQRLIDSTVANKLAGCDWTCEYCGETNAGNFQSCWNCGRSPDAEPDPELIAE